MISRSRELATLTLTVTLLAASTSFAYQESRQEIDRSKALKTLVEQFLASTKSGDKDKVADLTKALKLVEPAAFFSTVFDAENAKRLTAEHARFSRSFDQQLPMLFSAMLKRKRTEITVQRHAQANPKANGNQNKTLQAMKKPLSLYSVRFVEPGKPLGTHVYNFVYFDKAFRLVGVMRDIAPPASPQALALKKQLATALAASRLAGPGKLTPELKALLLPNHQKWFLEIFGAKHGPKLASDYAADTKNFDTPIPALFTNLVKRGQTEIHVLRFTAPNPNATGNQRFALKAMVKPTALYSARFVEPGKPRGGHLYSFVEIEGKFYLAGKMRGLPAD